MTEKLCNAYKHFILLALTCSVEAWNKNIRIIFIANDFYMLMKKQALTKRKTAGDGHGNRLRQFSVTYILLLTAVQMFTTNPTFILTQLNQLYLNQFKF